MVESMRALKQSNPSLPTAHVADRPVGGDGDWIAFSDPGPGARRAKLNADLLTPFDLTLLLDADTRPHGDLSPGFNIIEDGWDVALAPSTRQGHDCLGNVRAGERLATLRQHPEPLGLQAGLVFFRQSRASSDLFLRWREEWHVNQGEDQAALIRALRRVPDARVWLLGHPWNSQRGEVVEHLFGRAK